MSAATARNLPPAAAKGDTFYTPGTDYRLSRFGLASQAGPAHASSMSARRFSVRSVIAALVLSGAGCATLPPPPAPTPAPKAFGDILRFNEEERFVVVSCEVLPAGGDEATVWRSDQPVARIRFSGLARPPYATADVIDGWPQRGDRFRVEAKGARGGAETKR